MPALTCSGWSIKNGFKGISIGVVSALVILFAATSNISAQLSTNITPAGLNTVVTPPLPGSRVYGITNGTAVGKNLFHSFGEFSIGGGDIAQFQTSTLVPNGAMSNILGRVTGGNPSAIFGTIDSATYYPTANLFLMNPAGVIFGPTATLNVGGMATFATADYLRLAEIDGVTGMFHANPAATSVLTASPVATFGFLGSNPGAISVQGSRLTVTSGTGLALIGGTLTIESGIADGGISQPAQLSSPNGKIQLATAATPGQFDATTLQPLPDTDGASFASFGSVSLAPGSTIDVSGANRVSIHSGQFVLSMNDAVLNTAESAGLPETVSLSRNSSIISSNAGANPGGDIQIIARALQLDGTSVQSVNTGAGGGGRIVFSGESVNLTNGAQIVSSSEGSGGPGGDISILATGSVNISGYDEAATSGVRTDFGIVTSGVFAGTLADGSGGALTIRTPALMIADSGELATLAAGAGNGQPLTLDVETLSVKAGGRISSISGWNYRLGDLGDGPGQSGSISVQDATSISLSGTGSFGTPSLIQTAAFGLNGGGSASIEINAPSASLTLDNGSRIETFPGLTADPAGDINLSVGSLNILNGSVLGTTGGEGRSGNITILAADVVSIAGELDASHPSGIVSENGVGAGGTGAITIETRILTVSDRGSILNSAFNEAIPTEAPKISIRATDSVTLSNSSNVRVFSFLADVGDLNISTPTLSLSGRSNISTFGSGTGKAGAINIQTTTLSLAGGSELNSSVLTGSEGHGGNITVQGFLGEGTQAESVQLSGSDDAGKGSGILSLTQGLGAGGDIVVSAQSVILQNGAQVSSSSAGSGATGNINITAGNQFAMSNSSVTTEASQSSGGLIKNTTDPSGRVELTNSTISASVLDGTGGGGSVNIDPQFVILQNSQILAQAVQGPGGNINITITNGGLFLPDATSVVSASSQFGQSGTVTIQSPNAPAGGKIQPLGAAPLQVTALLSQRCAAIARGEVSSFVVAGRDTLPTEPGGWLTSPLASVPTGSGSTVQAGNPAISSHLSDPMILSLRRLPSSAKLAQMLSDDWLSDCGGNS